MGNYFQNTTARSYAKWFAGDNISALCKCDGDKYWTRWSKGVDYGRDPRKYFLFNSNFQYSGRVPWDVNHLPDERYIRGMSGIETRRLENGEDMYVPLLHQPTGWGGVASIMTHEVYWLNDVHEYLRTPKYWKFRPQDTDRIRPISAIDFTKRTNTMENGKLLGSNTSVAIGQVALGGTSAPVPVDIGRSFISEIAAYYIGAFGRVPTGYSCWDYARMSTKNLDRKLRMGDTMAEIERTFKVLNRFAYRMGEDEIEQRRSNGDRDVGETFGEVNYVIDGGLLVNVNTFFHSILVFYSDESQVDVVNSCARFYKQKRKARKSPSFWLLTHGPTGFGTSKMALKKFDLDLKANYNDDLPTAEIEKFIMEKTSSGLCLLHGTPGTGKTYYLRDLIRRMKDKKFIYMDKSALCYIGDSSFVQFLIENKDSVFIMEDCEAVLKDRAECNNVISVLLNLSDGMMGDAFNNKFICTFNTDISKIDKALIRKGRTRICYEFKPLKAAKATALARKLGSGKEYSEATPLCEVMNEASNGTEGIGARKERKVGF